MPRRAAASAAAAAVSLCALATAAAAFAPLPPTRRLPTRRAASSPDASDAALLSWGAASGVQGIEGLEVAAFAGERGVRAAQALAAGEPILSVPHALVLEVTTAGRPPRSLREAGWVSEESAWWRKAPWWAQLALKVAYEKETAATSARAPWLAALPQDFSALPSNWPPALLAQVGYPPLEREAARTAEERAALYATLRAAAPSPDSVPSEAAFNWAVATVRSRAFSGPFEGSTAPERALQLGFAFVLASVVAISGLAEEGVAINGLVVAAMSVLLRDFFLGKSGTLTRYVVASTLLLLLLRLLLQQLPTHPFSLRRYTLAPVIDLCNHRSGAPSDVAYEYFGDRFVLASGAACAAGDEVHVSYGDRTNDELVQLYGFVEAANPFDVFEFDDLLEFADGALDGGVPPGRFKALDGAGVVAAIASRARVSAKGVAPDTADALNVVCGGDQATAAEALRRACAHHRAKLGAAADLVESDGAGAAQLEAARGFRHAKLAVLYAFEKRLGADGGAVPVDEGVALLPKTKVKVE